MIENQVIFHILPYFGATVLILTNMLIFYSTGNALLGFWALYGFLLMPQLGIHSRFAALLGVNEKINS